MGGDEIEERRERDLSSLGLSGRAAAYNLTYHHLSNLQKQNKSSEL
jgi:hypothetical protein